MSLRDEEKVARLGLRRTAGEYILVLNGEIVALRAGGEQRVIASPGIVEEEGWTYFVDADGDFARKPQPGWVPSEAQRRGGSAAPLPVLRSTRLADVPFTTLQIHGTTVHESGALPVEAAVDLWRAARVDGFRPVLVRERIDTRAFEHLMSALPDDQRQLEKLDGRTVITERERLLRESATMEELRRRRDELAAATKITPPVVDTFAFQHDGRTKKRIFLCLVSCEPWELPLYYPVGGFNDAPSNIEIAAVLRHWSRDGDAAPVFIQRDRIEIEAQQPRDLIAARELAWQHYVMAPDVVEQGSLSLGDLVNAIAKHWLLWWD